MGLRRTASMSAKTCQTKIQDSYLSPFGIYLLEKQPFYLFFYNYYNIFFAKNQKRPDSVNRKKSCAVGGGVIFGKMKSIIRGGENAWTASFWSEFLIFRHRFRQNALFSSGFIEKQRNFIRFMSCSPHFAAFSRKNKEIQLFRGKTWQNIYIYNLTYNLV